MHLSPRKRTFGLAASAGVLALASALVTTGSEATITTTFDTTDGNLIADGDVDWVSVTPPAEVRATDLDTGSGDNSFGMGSKEDTAVPSVVDGSIPNNKSDLRHFGVYFEDTGTARYLHMFWHRVQEPSGTTNMDFEFNQSSTISANGVTPVRTAGDVLVQYDLASGGTTPELFVSRWVASGSASQCQAASKTPCWGTRVALGGDAVGSVNTVPIPAAESDGLGDVSPFTFGEATVDFDAVTGNSSGCQAFAYVYLKSRSSDSFTAALKDFIAPQNPGINSCGAVKITKTRKHAASGGTGPHAGVTFQLKQGNTVVVSGTTNSSGVVCFGGLEQGSYTVHEVPVAGYATNSDQSVTVDNAAGCTDNPYVGESKSFVNTPLTDITVSINSQVDGGTATTIDCNNNGTGIDKTIAAGPAPANGDGSHSVTGLSPGTYTCTVVIDP